MRLSLSLSLSVSLFITSCGNAGLCSASGLTSALAAAHAGDTVTVGACTIAGSFTVPSGVTLAGLGETSVLTSETGAAPVLSTESDARIQSLSLRVEHGGAGLRASGTLVTLESVDVAVVRGVGIGLDGAGVHATHVRVHGPVTAANVLSTGSERSTTGTFGIAGVSLGDHDVVLDDVAVTGFAVAAVSLTDGTLTWVGRTTGADVEATLGIGIALFGTHASFDSVEVTDILAGPGAQGVAVALAAHGARPGDVDVGDLFVHDGDGYGLFSDGAQVVAAGARFERLGYAGVRLQGGTFAATTLTCDANGGVGLVAIDVDSLAIDGGDLTNTTLLGIPTDIGTRDSGEGIQVVRDPGHATAPLDLHLSDVRLGGNARAGLLLDAADGAIGRLELTQVSASATGTAFGAVAQHATLPSGWDSGVTRSGAAIANDPTFSLAVSVQGIMMPPGLVASSPAF